MTEGYIITLGREALYTTLLICAPLLGVSLIIGLTIGIFQATTQLQVSFTQNLFMSIQNFTR